jgi:hypothetical protein
MDDQVYFQERQRTLQTQHVQHHGRARNSCGEEERMQQMQYSQVMQHMNQVPTSTQMAPDNVVRNHPHYTDTAARVAKSPVVGNENHISATACGVATDRQTVTPFEQAQLCTDAPNTCPIAQDDDPGHSARDSGTPLHGDDPDDPFHMEAREEEAEEEEEASDSNAMPGSVTHALAQAIQGQVQQLGNHSDSMSCEEERVAQFNQQSADYGDCSKKPATECMPAAQHLLSQQQPATKWAAQAPTKLKATLQPRSLNTALTHEGPAENCSLVTPGQGVRNALISAQPNAPLTCLTGKPASPSVKDGSLTIPRCYSEWCRPTPNTGSDPTAQRDNNLVSDDRMGYMLELSPPRTLQASSSHGGPSGGGSPRPACDITPGDYGGGASPSRPCLLLDLPVELVHSICLSKTMCSPEGGVSLSLLSRTCTVFGKAAKTGGTALLAQWTQQYCKEAGVRRLPLTMGDVWCWSRMLSWLSQAVRVGAQCELKTIKAGVAAAWGKQDEIHLVEGHLVEGSVLVLVENL